MAMTLTEIFESDDTLLLVNPSSSAASTEDQRVIQSFDEINVFIDQHKHKPGEADEPSVAEHGLQLRLAGLLVNAEKHALLRAHDRHGLLPFKFVEPQSFEIFLMMTIY